MSSRPELHAVDVGLFLGVEEAPRDVRRDRSDVRGAELQIDRVDYHLMDDNCDQITIQR